MSESTGYSDYFKKVGTPVRRRPDRDARVKKVHAVFNLLGILAGASAAYVAWDRVGSLALTIFAFFAANYLVGRGFGDVVTDDKKVKRFLFFVMPVLIDSGLIYLTYQWWDTMWLSVLIGFFAGGAIWAALSVIAFSDIQGEEDADNKERMAEALGQ